VSAVQREKIVKLTAAQVLALNATPVTLVAAPGAGKALELVAASLTKPAGTAYAGVAAGEDLTINYTSGAGLAVAGCEVTGFLDQTTAQARLVKPYNAASGVSDIVPVANAALVISMLTGEITTGDSPVYVTVIYRIAKTINTL
jgi:hypothetical protein